MSKSILITGTSSGFGKLAVKTLAADGHTVFASMRNVNGKNSDSANEIRGWANENNWKIEVVELDVTNEASVNAAAQTVLDKTGGSIDVVINNAGVYGSGIDESFTNEQLQTIFDVNVFGPQRVTHAFLPAMRKQNKGLIINVSSLLGRIVIPYAGAYCASKWALEALTENLRYELAPLGIETSLVQPGAFATEIFGKTLSGQREDVAAEYGPSLETMQGFQAGFGEMMQGEVPNQPQHVADAMKRIIDSPEGERPMRIAVDKMMPNTAVPLNNMSAEIMEGFLTNMQMPHLLPKAQPVEA